MRFSQSSVELSNSVDWGGQWSAVLMLRPDRPPASTCQLCHLKAASGNTLRLLCLSFHSYEIEMRDYPLHVIVGRIK